MHLFLSGHFIISSYISNPILIDKKTTLQTVFSVSI